MNQAKTYQLATETTQGDIIPFGPLMTKEKALEMQETLAKGGHVVVVKNLAAI